MSIVPWWVKLDILTGDAMRLAHVAGSGISGVEPVANWCPDGILYHPQHPYHYISIASGLV